jgi:hypothetical protein
MPASIAENCAKGALAQVQIPAVKQFIHWGSQLL